MKKTKSIILQIVFFWLFPLSVFAVVIPSPIAGDLISNLKRITSVIRPVVSIVFLAAIMYGGFLIESAMDNKDQVKKGWQAIQMAVVGLVVIFLAPSLLDLLGSLFGTDNLVDF